MVSMTSIVMWSGYDPNNYITFTWEFSIAPGYVVAEAHLFHCETTMVPSDLNSIVFRTGVVSYRTRLPNGQDSDPTSTTSPVPNDYLQWAPFLYQDNVSAVTFGLYTGWDSWLDIFCNIFTWE